MATATQVSTEGDVESQTTLEEEQQDLDEITQPFNPEEIKVRTVPILVDQIVSRITHAEIDLAPEFQRLAGIWDAQRKSRLIESLLLRIPIPVFYVAADEDDVWSVVDGVQRTSTIFGFVSGQFPLSRLEYLTHLNGKRHDDLPRKMQRRIGETQFVVHVIDPGTPKEVMFNIFLRLNTGGKPLNGQEIRHALHPGHVREFLPQLADSEAFLNATSHTISKTRMEDRELVLRFLAFYIDRWEKYSTNDLDGYLGAVMDKINGMDDHQRGLLATAFQGAMVAAYRIFNDDAFRKRYDPKDGRFRVSRALFESWSVGLARCSESQIETLVENRVTVVNKFMTLMNEDTEFGYAISYSTGTPVRVRKRFGAIDQLIKEVV